MFQTNLAKSKLAIPRKIPWQEITFPETWTMKRASIPQTLQHDQPDQIAEFDDGTVDISFDDQRKTRILSTRHSDVTNQSYSRRLMEPSRWSESRSPVVGIKEEPSGVSNPVYQSTSPTPSDMGYPSICVL